MARVVVAATAQQRLAELIISRSLPDTTRARVQRALVPLALFPRLGRELTGRWSPFRVILGPWPWMLIIYRYDVTADVVTVATIVDARTATAPS